jgi:hypothetical protein
MTWHTPSPSKHMARRAALLDNFSTARTGSAESYLSVITRSSMVPRVASLSTRTGEDASSRRQQRSSSAIKVLGVSVLPLQKIFPHHYRSSVLTQMPAGTPGFDISCDKQLLYNGSPEFWACPVDDYGVWNLYTKPNFAQKKCITITLSVHGESTPEPTCKQSTPPPLPCGDGKNKAGCKSATAPPGHPCKDDCNEHHCDCKTAPPPSGNGKLSPDGSCGGATGFHCNGFVDGSCCSSYGWCGSTPAHCGNGCQGDFGTCRTHKDDYKPAPPPPPPCKSDSCKPTPLPTCNGDKQDDNCKSIAPPPPPPCGDGKNKASCQPPKELIGCPADIKGPYEFPHLIIPVDKSWPDRAYGTKLNGTFSNRICTIFNFDIHPRFVGKSCSLTFLFPKREHLETSAYTFEAWSDKSSLQFYALKTPATWKTTWNSVGPKELLAEGPIYPDLAVGAYTHKCPAGKTESIMVCGKDVYLDYFQDFNPSPIGMFMRTC